MDEQENVGSVPAGRYSAVALPDTAKWGKASTGTEQIGLSFQITAGRMKGCILTWYGYMTADSKERTIDSLMLAGCTFPDDDLANLVGLGTKTVEVTVECDENPNTGEMRSRVSWVNEPGGVAMKDVYDAAGVKAVSEKHKADILAVKAKRKEKKSGASFDKY